MKFKAWLLIFGACFLYWAYLIPNTEMQIIYDSIDYEATGRLIFEQGWLEFFRTGPHREPLYPAVIALSMALAEFFSTQYQPILKIIQVGFLFLGQLFLLALLKRIQVRDSIIKAAVLYIGISPALINAALSVYSEIVSLPFVAAAAWVASVLCGRIRDQTTPTQALWGPSLALGFCLGMLAMGRGVFEYVLYIYLVIAAGYATVIAFQRNGFLLVRFLASMSLVFSIPFLGVAFVKTMNLTHNGSDVFARTHSSIVLASSFKRSQSISAISVGAHLATIPGTGVCRMLFSEKDCRYADWYGTEDLRTTLVKDEFAKIPKDRQRSEVFRLTLERIAAYPLQYMFFSGVEALKMPFWESTKIGFVRYPDILTRVYDNPGIRLGLRLVIGLITLGSLIFATLALWRSRRGRAEKPDCRECMETLFIVLFMIAAYTVPYSLTYVVTRYALPIAILYVVCIAFTLNSLINQRQ